MNVTLSVMARPLIPIRANQKPYFLGDIVGVHPYNGLPSNSPRTDHIHVTNTPDGVPLQRLKEVLKHKEINVQNEGEDNETREVVHQREWQIQITNMTQAQQDEWTTNHELTFTWLELRSLIHSRIKLRGILDMDFL